MPGGTPIRTGTSIALVTTTGPGYGLAEIWLDGVKQQTLDLYSATTHKKLIFWAPSTALTPGSHTLELTVLGTKNSHATSTRIDLDALLVWVREKCPTGSTGAFGG